MRSPKAKVPALRQLTNNSYSSTFINSAWKGYSKEVDDKYGFSFALEWHIESNLVDAIEFKVLNASTCLELLMDKLTYETNSEGIVDRKIFRQFRKSMKSHIYDKLRNLKLDESTIDLIYQKFGKINRRSYVENARKLLEYWKISYDDADMGLEEIVKVRNNITHRGRHYVKDQDSGFEEVFRAYRSLALILPRVFLAMLKYDGQYYDSMVDRWIQFSEVCGTHHYLSYLQRHSLNQKINEYFVTKL